MPEQESLPIDGVSYSLGRSYNANGHLSTLSYPYNLVVDYNPNALGEATTVGTYAQRIAYHPNGGIAYFAYGNGLNHFMGYNVRELPESASTTGVHNDTFTYDGGGNLVNIRDHQETSPTAA